jgi:hypothetical protein
MKFRPIYIAIIFVLIAVIFLSTSSCSNYVPYMKTTYFDHAYPYEGMSNFDNAASFTPKDGVPTSGNVSSSNGESSNSYFSWMKSFTGDSKATNTVAKVEGFALQPSPLNEPAMLDRFGKTPSDKSCFGKSMGLSRDVGPLCFNEDDLRLLTTRGGNATGGDSPIGQQ